MSYSYSVDPTIDRKNNYSLAATSAGVVVGAGVGAYLGIKHNPYVEKDGKLKDTFTKSVEKAYMQGAEESEKNLYNQLNTVAKKIKNIEKPDALKTLIETNPEVKNIISTNYITDQKNLKDCIKNILKEVESKQEAMRFNNVTLKVKWDNKNKKFEELTDPKDANLNNAVKKAKLKIKSLSVAKYISIGAIITGALAYITNLFLSSSNKNVQ